MLLGASCLHLPSCAGITGAHYCIRFYMDLGIWTQVLMLMCTVTFELPLQPSCEWIVCTEATERSDLSKWYLYFRKALDMCWFSNCVVWDCCWLQSHGPPLEPLSWPWVSVWAFASFPCPNLVMSVVAENAAASVLHSSGQAPFMSLIPSVPFSSFSQGCSHALVFTDLFLMPVLFWDRVSFSPD